ncbi:MAG TPA: hypothetical protein ENN29_05575 [Candidatus Hydrogenedentes bacterium]|nr:hypothetical protein [Candidatus Hydrogenedentota bacterium]
MHRISRIERRSLLTGWIKWALLPMIPFSILFFDAWLNIQVRYKDYELGRLNAVRRELNEELDVVRAKEASLSGVEHLTVMAEQMELASPKPQQFRVIAYRETPRRIPVMNLAQKEMPPLQPVVISLEGSSDASVAASARRMNPGDKSASMQIGAPQHEDAPAPASASLDDTAAPVYGNTMARQPLSPMQDIYSEDSELSLLSVEDMLGRL